MPFVPSIIRPNGCKSGGAQIPSFEEARHLVETRAAELLPSKVETVDLLQAAGRVLAEPVSADRDIPPFPRATRDGYAVRAADVAKLPSILKVIGEIRAGEKPEKIPAELSQGQAVSIMTGAPVPHGADAVVMVEYTSREGEIVEINRVLRRERTLSHAARRRDRAAFCSIAAFA